MPTPELHLSRDDLRREHGARHEEHAHEDRPQPVHEMTCAENEPHHTGERVDQPPGRCRTGPEGNRRGCTGGDGHVGELQR